MQETLVQSLGQEDPLEKGQPTPVFLPGESHGERSLVGYSPWGRTELDTNEWLTHTHRADVRLRLINPHYWGNAIPNSTRYPMIYEVVPFWPVEAETIWVLWDLQGLFPLIHSCNSCCSLECFLYTQALVSTLLKIPDLHTSRTWCSSLLSKTQTGASVASLAFQLHQLRIIPRLS